jgi:hypothetical protein
MIYTYFYLPKIVKPLRIDVRQLSAAQNIIPSGSIPTSAMPSVAVRAIFPMAPCPGMACSRMIPTAFMPGVGPSAPDPISVDPYIVRAGGCRACVYHITGLGGYPTTFYRAACCAGKNGGKQRYDQKFPAHNYMLLNEKCLAILKRG